MNNEQYKEDIKDILNDAILERNKTFALEFQHLNLQNYYYKTDEAVAELDIESEIIDELIEDYVKQIMDAETKFINILNKLKQDQTLGNKLDFKELRELAHKNLGVARNLRIVDAQSFLTILMKEDNLEAIQQALSALVLSTVILKPEIAYNTMLNA